MINFLLKEVALTSVYRQVFKTTVWIICIFSLNANAQNYTSNFADPAGNFSATAPSGGTCVAATLNGASNVADADLNNYVSISGLLNAPLTYTDPLYAIRAKLNFPQGTTFAPAGYFAGFRVQFSSVLSVSLLQSNLSLRTYLGGVLRETITGANIVNISLLASTDVVPLYFISTQTFDEVELIINGAVLPLDVALDYRIFSAFGSIEVLPVSFGNVSAKLQSGQLNVAWNTLSESNNDRFLIQGATDGQTWVDLGTVASKAVNGQSSTNLSYSFTMPWSGTLMAGVGLLGLFLLPAVRNRWLKAAMVLFAVVLLVSCAKENNGIAELERNGASIKPLYVRVVQVDKDGKMSYSQAVVAKP